MVLLVRGALGATRTVLGFLHFCRSASNELPRQCRKYQAPGGYFENADPLWKKVWREVNLFSAKEGPVAVIERVMDENRGKVTKQHIKDTILRLRLQTRHEQARKVVEWLVDGSPFKISPADLVLRIEIVGRLYIDRAVRYFRDLAPEVRTEAAYRAMLKTYARWHMVDEAESLMNEMKSLSFLGSSVEPYNVMLNMYRRKNLEQRIRSMYEEMEAAGVEVDTETYLIALRSKKLVGGFSELEDRARRHLDSKMQGLARQPVYLLECMIRTYAALGDLTSIEKVWDFLKRYKRVSSSTYLVMVESYGLLGEVGKAGQVFKEMEEMYSNVNGELLIRHFRSLLAAYTDNGAMDKAREVYKRAMRIKREVSPAIHHHMIEGYIKVKDYENALRCFEILRDKAHSRLERPLRSTVLIVMKLHANSGNIQAAEKLLYEEGRFKRYTGPAIYNLVLRAYINAEVPVFNFQKRMRKAGVEPDEETKELLSVIEMPCKDNDDDWSD